MDQAAPIDFSDFMRSEEARREPGGGDSTGVILLRPPNRGHRRWRNWSRDGNASSVITQNIDGLHQDPASPRKVIELHGNTTYAHCLTCGQRYEIDELRVDFERDSIVPHCACGGMSRPRRSPSARRCRVTRCSAPRPRRWLRSVHRAWFVAGGLSGGGVSGIGETEGRVWLL